MNNINLTSNEIVRNMVLVADFVVALAVALLVVLFHPLHFPLKIVHLILDVLLAMTLAQAVFSSTIHLHHVRIDKIMARTSWMAFWYGIIMYGSAVLYKWITGEIIIPGRVAAVVIAITYVLLGVTRLAEYFIMKTFRRRGRNSRTVLLVGMEDRLNEVLNDIDSSITSGLRFIGYYAPNELEELTNKMPYWGDYEALEQKLKKGDRLADDIFCALPMEYKHLNKMLVHNCMLSVSHFYYVPIFIDGFGEYLKPSMIGEQVVFANFTEPLLDPTKRAVKRAFDIICSALALIVLLPFFPIIALIIKSCSPGPIFFKQARTGLRGKDFMMLKFRSMHVNSDADKVQATKDDPRKYPFGDFMRRTSIDELPQIWNIFVGDMSIVGPRPHMRKHTEEYKAQIDDYMMRHYIRPGLTGWAQITGFRGETPELWQMEGRVKRDIWYIQNWTFWLDIRIIFKTAKQVMFGDQQAY